MTWMRDIFTKFAGDRKLARMVSTEKEHSERSRTVWRMSEVNKMVLKRENVKICIWVENEKHKYRIGRPDLTVPFVKEIKVSCWLQVKHELTVESCC